MNDSKILHFPQPQHDLSPSELAQKILDLSDAAASILCRAEPSDLNGLLKCLEEASLKLKELGDLVLHGTNRVRADNTIEGLRTAIAHARVKLDLIDHLQRSNQ